MTWDIPAVPIGDWADAGIGWLRANAAGFFDGLSAVLAVLTDVLTDLLTAIPEPLAILLFALIAWLVRSWKMALATAITFLLIWSMGQWVTSMQTLALVLIATVIAVVLAVPLGIWAARNDTVSAVLKPVLDFMQTMPAFVYLIPAILFFGIGAAPGLIATLIFALPPGVRMTELGIRGVDHETVEAGHSFGATGGQILRGIQLPLAVPTIMAGVNQVIMLALSMAVIAGMVGADGLGKEVVSAISTLNTAKGVEAGLSVVFLAIYLDRLTGSLARPGDHPTSLLALLRERRKAAATAS